MEIQIEEIRKKLEELKKEHTLDLSSEEDLAIGIMHLINLEEHFYFTSEKTGTEGYLDFMKEIREIRKNLLAQLIEKYEGEVWCISKHLLGATYRLFEVGEKYYSQNEKDKAKRVFDYGYRLFNIFWGLKLKMIDIPQIKKEADKKAWTLKDIVEKLVNCCDE